MAMWSGKSVNRGMIGLAIVVPVLMLGLTIVLWSSTTPSWVLVMNVVLAVAILAALIIFASLRVDITADAFVVRWGPMRWPVRTIAWTDVSAVGLVSVDPWDWGGWGYRWAPGGRGTAAVVRRGPAIQLDLASGKRFTVTVDDAQSGVDAATAALAHRGD